MSALGAPEESDLALICSPELAQPPECKVVFTLGAFDLDCRESFYLLAIILNNGNLVIAALELFLHLIRALDLPHIPALAAFELASGREEHTLAFRAKHLPDLLASKGD